MTASLGDARHTGTATKAKSPTHRLCSLAGDGNTQHTARAVCGCDAALLGNVRRRVTAELISEEGEGPIGW